jgi:hypothetical protein
LTQEYDRPSIGATSGSPPMPSPEPEQYQMFSTLGAFELENSQKISTVNNRIDHLELRIDLLDEVARILLEGQDYNEGDFLKWFKSHKEKLAKMQTQRTN